MAADVSTGTKEECDAKNGDLVTMDLLGGGFSGGGSGVQIEAPVDWEKKLDLMFGKKKDSESEPTYRPIQDLNLSPPRPTPTSYSSSVCTLEKVKYALERAKSDGSASSTKRPPAMDEEEEEEEEEEGTDGEDSRMMIGLCSRCMQYLLVRVVEPTCPKCGSHVPFPPYMSQQQQQQQQQQMNGKKAKIDLNSTASASASASASGRVFLSL